MSGDIELQEISPQTSDLKTQNRGTKEINCDPVSTPPLDSYLDKSNFFSWITVSFFSKIIKIGTKRPLVIDDLGATSEKLNPAKLYSSFEKEWAKECEKEPAKRSLVSTILRSNGLCYWSIAIILNIISCFLSFVPTMILNLFVKGMEDETTDDKTFWLYAGILLVVPVLTALVSSTCMMMILRVAVSMKSMVSEAIYRKALRLSSVAKGTTSTGQLVNIMSTDTNSLLMFTISITIIVILPIMLVICVVMTAEQMGNITWIAVGIYAVMMIIEIVVTFVAEPIRLKIMSAADARVKLMNEVLTGIRVIKYYCWEKPFKGKVHDSRHAELNLIKKMTYLMTCGIDMVLNLIPQFVPLICFSVYPSVMGKPLTSSVAFTSFSLFNILMMPFGMMPYCMMLLVQFRVSIKRITGFLNLEEVDPTLVEKNLPAGSKPSYKDINGVEKTVDDYDAEKDAIVIRDGYFAWGESEPCLKNITTRIPKGSLVAVVGRVGSGKTSFVSSLVGEMTKKAGTVLVNGSMSLSAQQAWLVNDTVRNNILFGKDYDEKKYNEIIKACSLEDDLKVLSGGDQCEIGDRGINVSGGQKARISLARACYSDSDIVVMDDPIAAVDSHVGKALFNKCIHKYMQGRTRILVTNATQYLHKCDYIIVLENQTISHQGTYAELKSQNIDLMALLTEEDGSSSFAAGRQSQQEQEASKKQEESNQPGDGGMDDDNEGSLTTTETKKTGKVSWSVYQYYFKSVGWAIVITMIVCLTIAAVFNAWTRFVLSDWSEDTTCIGENVTDTCTQTTNHYITYYAIINVLYMVFTFIRLFVFIPGRIRCSQNIHDNLTETILDAPVSFHDVTPVGRILNRFNRDMARVDYELGDQVVSFLQELFFLIAEIIVIIWSTRGLMAVVIILAFIVYYIIQDRFRRSNTDIQRIEALTRTPIFSDFQGVLTGSPSIRAYGHQQRFIEGIEKKLNTNNNCLSFWQFASTWLSVRSDVIAAFLCFVVAVIAIFGKNFMSPGLLGAGLSSCTSLNSFMRQMVKMLAELEAQMSSVERIKEYVEEVKPEPPMITDVRPPAGWPSEGKIEFNNAKLRYRDGPLVMKGVNLSIDKQEKIGVVGRTGAGKSTMMIALFRITDLCEGSITIDGMDLAKMGLEDVRRGLCIIPQDPVLFSASVRFNLDPFNESTDEDIWSVLEEVELKDVIQNLPKGLDDDVHEGGSNFSVGERQLICMARALLRKPKILIMDEATASLDNTTDTFLQQMIRKQFAQCTTLTIAHRLNTIMDASRVCVMDQGVVAEYDTPYNLLHKENGIFKGMVLAANDPTLFDMVPGCEEMKELLNDNKQSEKTADSISPVTPDDEKELTAVNVESSSNEKSAPPASL